MSPAWFIVATALFTIVILGMAVAETSIWTHYLIDQGEFLCLGGLAFALVAGLHLYRTGKLSASLPLFVPWLLYPIVTQGDQIIDNLTINGMRLFAHAVLLVLFLAPVAITAVAVRRFASARSGRVFIPIVLALEIWIAHQYLGAIMVALLVASLLAYAAWVLRGTRFPERESRRVTGKAALGLLVTGIVLSLALYLGYKHRPGAYQGSPHHFHDPTRPDDGYVVHHVPPAGEEAIPLSSEAASEARSTLLAYGRALEELLAAYYVLDRNYNYAFHNALFLRHSPVSPGFRARSLQAIGAARYDAAKARESRPSLPCSHPAATFVEEVERFTEFNFRRASMLERMSAEFEKTEAGLQHATHLYEGEGKVMGIWLASILDEHRAFLARVDSAEIASPFLEIAARIQARYADRVVGF
jgi:hypothetical protein